MKIFSWDNNYFIYKVFIDLLMISFQIEWCTRKTDSSLPFSQLKSYCKIEVKERKKKKRFFLFIDIKD